MYYIIVFLKLLDSQETVSGSGLFGILKTIVERGKFEEAQNGVILGRNDCFSVCHRLWHALKRVLSYKDAIENFAVTVKRWPDLFTGITIKTTTSIDPKPYNFSNFDRLDVTKLFKELNPGIHDDESARKKWHGLDKKLGKCGQELTNERRVHAEVKLWSHIEQELSTFVPFSPANPHAYDISSNKRVVIGVSKPTCILCHLFFQKAAADRLVIRSSSMNVYHRWALPSFLSAAGIPEMLYDAMDYELSEVLKGGETQRSENDTDSAPNSASLASLLPYSFPSDTSDSCSSTGWSHQGREVYSSESLADQDLETIGRG